jgi:hypothetical protein
MTDVVIEPLVEIREYPVNDDGLVFVANGVRCKTCERFGCREHYTKCGDWVHPSTIGQVVELVPEPLPELTTEDEAEIDAAVPEKVIFEAELRRVYAPGALLMTSSDRRPWTHDGQSRSEAGFSAPTIGGEGLAQDLTDWDEL